MCTGIRFTDKEGNLYFGRNLDWTFGYGQNVFVAPKGFKRTWAYQPTKEAPGDVIGMAIAVDGMPLYFDCANDQGLAIAGLNYPGKGFGGYAAEPVEGRTNVAAYEFPFWVASNFTTVDEAEAAIKEVTLVGKQVAPEYPVSYLHWLVGDKNRSIVVEHQDDGMHVYENPVDALTNQPGFPWQLENLRNYVSLTPEWPGTVTWDKHSFYPYGSGSGMRGMPGDFYSPSRFVRAAYFNSHHPQVEGEQENIARLFRTLMGSAFVKGATKVESGDYEYTLYTGGYSQATKTYYYNTYDDLNMRVVKMSDAPSATELYEAK